MTTITLEPFPFYCGLIVHGSAGFELPRTNPLSCARGPTHSDAAVPGVRPLPGFLLCSRSLARAGTRLRHAVSDDRSYPSVDLFSGIRTCRGDSTVFHQVLTNISGWRTGVFGKKSSRVTKKCLLIPVRHPLIFVKTWWGTVSPAELTRRIGYLGAGF